MKVIDATLLTATSIARAQVKQYIFDSKEKKTSHRNIPRCISVLYNRVRDISGARNRVSYVLLDPDEAQTLL